MKLKQLLSYLVITTFLLCSEIAVAQTTITIGTGSSSSSTRGPFQRADTNSTTVFSRWIQVFTAAELATAGMTSGASISQLNWELASSNVIIGNGDATLKIYVKNSSATAAVSDTWANHIMGSTLVVDNAYNTTNNFPGANGWMPFSFSAPFTYTGGALEVAVDWDCSQVSTPAFSGNGAIKFRWNGPLPNDLVVKKTSSSAPSTNITDLKDERANIQIVYTMGGTCDDPTNLSASNITMNSTEVSWAAVSGASSYNWKVVAAGAGSAGTAVASGNTAMTSDTASGLMTLTSYDLYVETDCNGSTSSYAGPYTFLTLPAGTTTVTIGAGTSSSSTRGPFQRSDTNSTTVFSRFVQIYTAAELAAVGITNGMDITEVQWDLASSNTIIGNGDATLKVYVKNSSATAAVSDTWANHIMGSTLVVDNAYNTTNNFPGANGWMPFSFSAPFTYAGGALEVAVDWDCSQVSTPAFSGDGALKWRWESTAPDNLVVKKTSSSAPSTSITDLKDERANIQFVYASAPPSMVDVTFRVNMSLADSVAFDGVFLAGDFNGWNNTLMTDMNNDSTYEVTIAIAENTNAEFKFKNGANDWESIDTLFGTTCTVAGGNRSAMISMSDTTLLDYCFNTCVSCDVVVSTEVVPQTAEFKIMPNPANNYVQLVFNTEFSATEKAILVQNAMGQIVLNRTVNHVDNYAINTAQLSNGMYFITVRTEEGIQTKRLVVSH